MKIPGLIVVLMLIFSVLGTAQRHQIGLGAAYHAFKVEEASGTGYYLNYLRPFGEQTYIGLSAGIAEINGSDSLGMSQKQMTYVGSLQFLYAGFENDYQRLLVGGGVSGRYFSDKWLLDENLQTQQATFKPGFELLVDYSFFITEFTWVISSRASYQLYEKGNSVWTIGGHLAYRF